MHPPCLWGLHRLLPPREGSFIQSTTQQTKPVNLPVLAACNFQCNCENHKVVHSNLWCNPGLQPALQVAPGPGVTQVVVPGLYAGQDAAPETINCPGPIPRLWTCQLDLAGLLSPNVTQPPCLAVVIPCDTSIMTVDHSTGAVITQAGTTWQVGKHHTQAHCVARPLGVKGLLLLRAKHRVLRAQLPLTLPLPQIN